jgi:hypothetical protein
MRVRLARKEAIGVGLEQASEYSFSSTWVI